MQFDWFSQLIAKINNVLCEHVEPFLRQANLQILLDLNHTAWAYSSLMVYLVHNRE